ncbi:MAG TPA: hypothetical protein VMF06_03545 [Candidatus Limnocylindria bacterium]|jgi:hypothetical protein|nr:hypothetical protein [Candidatus Limnocylindria bacterium]
MSAKDRLFAAYDQWRQWSEKEGQAIQASDWPVVRDCQRAKLELQPQILRFTETSRTEHLQTGGDWKGTEREVRRQVSELIALEMRNETWLHEVRERAESQLTECSRSRRSLRQVHRSYVPPAAPAWASYS